jgi:BASS family bile acid:Na+ symporter
MTPLLVLWLAGDYLPVNFFDMFIQILQMVIIPVTLGLIVRFVAKKFVSRIIPMVPWISVLILSLVIAGIMAGNADIFLGSALAVIVAVILHNILGFTLGYLVAKLSRLNRRERRAVAIEVGMQNAGLSAALANSNYAPLAALPSAIATIWHNIGGALLSFIFVWNDRTRANKEKQQLDNNKNDKSQNQTYDAK